MAKDSGLNLGLNAFDDLFETDESREDAKRERLMVIPIEKIKNFPDHPYRVLDDDAMNELVESIKTRGLIQPILIRPIEEGMYEMVSGHRRKRAFELAGIAAIPARVKEMSRDEAILSMVDSNLQRDEILPSEKAKAYKMRLEAMKRQAGRPPKENSSPVATNLSRGRSDVELSEMVGESKDQIRRYIRLTNLIPELLDMVDEKQIAMRPAVEISYLSEEAQHKLHEAMDFADATPSHYQTIRMRKFADEGKLTDEVIEAIMSEEKPNQKEKSPFRDERIEKAIPKGVPREQHSEFVLKAIEHYTLFLQRSKNRDRGAR